MTGGWNYCPSCGESDVDFTDGKLYTCPRCGFHFYQNIAAAVGVILTAADRRMLWVVREKEPGAGLLDLPGGFLDPGETLESAARREIAEELDLQLDHLEYFASYPNTYPYRGITYHTSDAFFIAPLPRIPDNDRIDRGEIRSVELIRPEDLDPERIAFASHRTVHSDLLSRSHPGSKK